LNALPAITSTGYEYLEITDTV